MLRSYAQYIFVFLILLFALLYIVKLKFSIPNNAENIFVVAQLQPAEWWSTSEWMPTKILSGLDTGSTTDDGEISIEQLRYFHYNDETWNKLKNGSFGSIYLKIHAKHNSGKWMYQNQELLVGNPLSIVIDNTSLELLISRVQTTPVKDDYAYQTFESTIFNVREEFIQEYKPGKIIYDNTGTKYLEIVSVEVKPSLVSSPDQFGILRASADPFFKDVFIVANVLCKKTEGTLETYDGSLLETGQKFVFNSPELSRLTAWITSVDEISDNGILNE